jgi:hypothetical protein
MDNYVLTARDFKDIKTPRMRKMNSLAEGLKKSSHLPKILTPRQSTDFHQIRKKSVPDLGIRLAVLGPLPSIKIKTKNKDKFGESPILTVQDEHEQNDLEVAQVLTILSNKRVFSYRKSK